MADNFPTDDFVSPAGRSPLMDLDSLKPMVEIGFLCYSQFVGALPVVDARIVGASCSTEAERLVGAPDAVLDAIANLIRVGGEADVAGDVTSAVAGANALVDEAPVGWLVVTILSA